MTLEDAKVGISYLYLETPTEKGKWRKGTIVVMLSNGITSIVVRLLKPSE